jgi:hypothetical protein
MVRRNELASLLMQQAGRKVEVEPAAERTGEIRFSSLYSARLRDPRHDEG